MRAGYLERTAEVFEVNADQNGSETAYRGN